MTQPADREALRTAVAPRDRGRENSGSNGYYELMQAEIEIRR